jgi:hypothetical protein
MAYKQNPGRSPFLKTGRNIPLNFLQNSPLHDEGKHEHPHTTEILKGEDLDKWHADNPVDWGVDDSETEVMPIDKTASGERSTFSTNIGDYALNTQGRRDEYTKRGWAQDDTTKITPTSGGKSAKITKGKDLVTAGKATKKEGRQLKREGRRDDRITKAKGKIKDTQAKLDTPGAINKDIKQSKIDRLTRKKERLEKKNKK